ncbi:hypothetical protein DJ84_02645 [Halorubrum ezzemoulense]|nr:hypothetical protein DJ84_02645 [Halorubrum ezzemoulense]
MTDHDIAIIGGGIFGVSVAKHLAELTDYDTCLIEKENRLAAHQSGRNSGVLHPGLALNLEPETQKAEFAIEGSRRLREYCRERELPIRDTGLLLVATDDTEAAQLDQVYDRVATLGIDVERLDEDGIAEHEPHVRGSAALYTPDSSTVDTQPITYELSKDARRGGVEFYLGTEVKKVARAGEGIRIQTNKGEINADYLVNAAGTAAVQLAHQLDVATEFSSVPFRGQYYELTTDRRELVRTNVYPVSMPPRVPNQVGVHFTRRPDNKVIVGPTGMIAFGLDTYGRAEFDLEEVARTVASSNFWRFIGSADTIRIAWRELNKTYRKKTFLDHCQKLLPGLTASDISRSYVGISHYVLDKKGQIGDASRFATGERSSHILRPKPGLTSSLSIGEYIANEVKERY